METMTSNPPGSTLPSGGLQSPQTSPQVTVPTFAAETPPCLPSVGAQYEEESEPFLQRDSALYGLEGVAAVRSQRFGGVATDLGTGQGEPAPYSWHLGDRADGTYPPHWPHPFNYFRSQENLDCLTHSCPDQSECLPETLTLTHLHPDQSEGHRSWDHYGGNLQEQTLTVPAGVYSVTERSAKSHYVFQNSQDATQNTLYPKPIYSYSILIFLALRNSKTGSLPVSEIYSFMTEHFPYFKTAPDGWKNSVRHNLSLNKCFEKVENRSGGAGGSSRKGCLWALNPARVEKMQEELHKWRRKDPLTVRKSMARPEELDCLLGDWPERPSRRLAPQPHGLPGLHRHPPLGLTPPARPDPAPRARLHSHPPYLPPAPDAFSYHTPSRLLPPLGRTGSLDSPLPAQTAHTHGAALLAEHCTSRSAQELPLEGDLGNDIDALNPSLTVLPLHGKLWEEIRDDSLFPDSVGVTVPLPSSPSPATPGPSLLDLSGAEEEERDLPDHCISTLYGATFVPLEGMTGYLPAPGCTAISLM